MTNLQQFADFTDKNIFVGIDVHKKSWSVSLYHEQMFLRTFTQPPSSDVLTKFLQRDFPGADFVCGYESGFSGFWIQRQLEQKGIKCLVIHPADIPHTHKRKTAKTDAVDSRSIAEALSARTVKSIYIPDPEIEGDRSLIRHRDRVLKDIQRCKHRIRSFLFQFGFEVPAVFDKSWSNKFVQWLKTFSINHSVLRATLNHMIEQMELLRSSFFKVNKDVRVLQNSEKFKSTMALLLTIPGVGPLTGITLLTEIVDINRFSSRKHLNSFVGLYPMEYSSGEHEYKGGITVRHNLYLRKLMVEAAWVAIRHDPALLLVYEDWSHRMTGKRAIVKVARKLLARIRHVWQNEKVYIKGIQK